MRCPRLTTRSTPPRRRTARTLAHVVLAPLLLAFAACAPAGPRDLRYGEEACGYCRMTITDRRFGGQAVDARGRVQAFDAIECLADWMNARPVEPVDAPPRAWVADFQRPGTWLAVDSARFVRLARASSPMGAGLAAVSPDAPAGALAIEGAPMTWAEVRTERAAHAARAKAGSHAH